MGIPPKSPWEILIHDRAGQRWLAMSVEPFKLPTVSAGQSRGSVGVEGESAALAHYRRAGYRLVARNWRCALGELDLVMARGGTLVFCEVKTRRSAGHGGPFEAVTWKKQAKLRALAQAFLLVHRGDWDEIRFDVASVMEGRDGTLSVHVFDSAF